MEGEGENRSCKYALPYQSLQPFLILHLDIKNVDESCWLCVVIYTINMTD